MLVIVVCLLSLSTVLSTSVNSFFDDDIAQNFEHNYSVAELLFHLTNGILLLKEKCRFPLSKFSHNRTFRYVKTREESFLDRRMEEAEGRCKEGSPKG